MNLLLTRPLFLNSWYIISSIDFLLLPVFAMVLFALFVWIRNQRYKKNDSIRGYFIPALAFRFVGAFLTAMMYQYYYGYGDTFYYFSGSSDIFRAFLRSPALGLEMILSPYEHFSREALKSLTYHILFRQHSSAVVMQMGGFFSIFTFGSYIGISLCMTALAFIGNWMLYRVFHDLYPHLEKPLAYAVLFVPSLCFWGTGLMKDSLSLAGLGMFVYGIYFIFQNRSRGILLPGLAFVLGLYLIVTIKVYIAVAILPAALVWITLLYRDKIKIRILRQIAGPFLMVFGGIFGLVALQYIGQVSEKFALENIALEAAKTQWWLTVSTERDGGTGYTLGEIDPTIFGMVKMFPKAVNVSLFRPYLWEARKLIVLPSAAEALFSLLFTLFVFFKVGFFRTLGTLFREPTVLFCLIFALIFAFAVGFTSMNFGALARYKIPCLPFYFTALIILLDSRNKKARAQLALEQKTKVSKMPRTNPLAAPLQ